MGEWLSGGLPLDFIVIDFEFGSEDFSQFAEVGEHSAGGHDGFVSHLNQLRFVSGNDTVSLAQAWITSDDDEIFTCNCYDCTSIINIRIESWSALVLNV